MDQHADDELDRLRAKAELDVHRADREREYQRRLALLETASAYAAVAAHAGDASVTRLLDLVTATVAEVHAQGYAIVPGLLDLDRVQRLRHALEPLFVTTRRMFGRLDPGGDRQCFHIHNVLAKTRAVDEVAVHPLLRAIVGGVLGQDFILHAGAVVMAPDPGCSPQGLHRDDASYALLPRPRMPLVLTAAIALDDFTRANGGTHLVPGSCWWPAERRPTSAEVIQCEMPAGAMLVWDGAIFHAGGGNVTQDRSRRTLTFNYTRGWLRTQFNQYLSMPRDLVLSLPPDLQKDLGYQPSARGLGECDNQNPLAYLRRMVADGGDGAQPRLGHEAGPAPPTPSPRDS